MTTAEPIPMATTPDPRPDPDTAAPAAAPAAGARSRAVLGNNLLVAIVVTIVGGLLTVVATILGVLVHHALTIDDSRIDRLEDTMAAGFAAVDERFLQQDAKIDALDTNLTAKIDDEIDALDTKLTGKIDALDAKLTGKIDDLDAKLTGKIDDLDTKVDETNRKLTALIAGLDKTEEVDAAVEGRLPEPEPASAPG